MKLRLLFLLQLLSFSLFASEGTNDAITIDGQLDEGVWAKAKHFSGFYQNFPADTALADASTDVWLLVAGDQLLIGAKMYNEGGKARATTLRRDFSLNDNDAFGILLNPDGDKLRGFGFQANPYGGQTDFQIFSGNKADLNWNVKWQVASSRKEGYWELEMSIPFSSLKFDPGKSSWHINFYRSDMSANEFSSWQPVPRNFALWDLTFTSPVEMAGLPQSSSKPLTFIPSLTTSYSLQQDAAGKGSQALLKPSLDVKAAVSPALNLDMSLNPDFSQVEVDQLQANFSRFELFLPEKRQFFIENGDLFAEFGQSGFNNGTIRPFYSRRIGLGYNQQTKGLEQVPIWGGLRLTGMLWPGLRFGVMSMQTAAQPNFYQDEQKAWHHLPSQNYSALVLQQNVFRRSSLGFIFVNRQAFGSSESREFGLRQQDYNQVAGLEYTHGSLSGKWSGKAYLHHSFTGLLEQNRLNMEQSAWGTSLQYNSSKLFLNLGQGYVGKSYNAEAGFVPRRDYYNMFAEGRVYFYPKKRGLVNMFYPIISGNWYANAQGETLDSRFIVAGTLRFTNSGFLNAWFFSREHTVLRQPFDPSMTGRGVLPAASSYTFYRHRLTYFSGNRKPWQMLTVLEFGEYYTGSSRGISGNVGYRFQPWLTSFLSYNYTRLQMPAPLADNEVFFGGLELRASLSRSLFADMQLQYNSLGKSIGIYARLQWEFKQLSNLFLVYQDNYYESFSQLQRRNLSAKLVYWF